MHESTELKVVGGEEKKSQLTSLSNWAVLVGIFFIPLICFWVIEAEIIVATIHATVLSLPFAAATVLILLSALNTLLHRWFARFSFTSSELLIVYAMIAVATTLFSIDTMTLLVPMMSYAFWFASPENRWAELFHDYLPSWLVVSDKEVLRGYYYGDASFWRPDILKRWLPPLTWWWLFVAMLVIASVGIALLLSRRWVREERLSYPLTRFPLELIRPSLWLNRWFWIALLLTGSIEIVNGLNFLYPSVPSLKLQIDLGSYFVGEPWSAVGWLPMRFYPFIAAVTYFAPTDLSLSLWLFFVLWKVQAVMRHWLGWQFPGTYLGEQVCGAWLGLALSILWGGRKSLGNAVVQIAQHPSGRKWVVSTVTALIFILAFWSRAGMGFVVAFGYFVLYWLLVIASARMRAELGPPTHELHFIGPDALLVHTFGASAFSSRSLTTMSLLYWLVYGFRAHPLPSSLEAFKLAEQSEMSPFSMATAILIAGLEGMLVAPLLLLTRFYRLGAVAKVQGYSIYPSRETFDRLANWLSIRPNTRWDIVKEVVIGTVVAAGLTAARGYWVWFPLHPVGYAVGSGWTMSWMWFSVFVGWMLKSLILRYGGSRAYHTAIPFFVGAITGQLLLGSTWSIYGIALGRKAYSFFP